LADYLLHQIGSIKLLFWRRCRGLKKNKLPRQLGTCSFLAPLPGKSGRPLQGEFFAYTSFTLLLFCFTLFILPASFYIKNPKKLESLVVVTPSVSKYKMF
jgi:hypothetical protein